MKPLLRYVPTDKLSKHSDVRSIDKRPCVNESAERDARVREGVGLRNGMDVIPAMFASYGNGPFLMPSLQFPG